MVEAWKPAWSIRDLAVSAPQVRASLLLRVRAPTAATFEALGARFDGAWPVTPNTASGRSPQILWLSPEEWLLAGGETARVRAALDLALRDHLHFVSDVTAGRVTFVISGDRARDLLARGCSLDLHPRVFPPDRCAQTLFAHIPGLIQRVDGLHGFELTVDAVYQDHIATWMAAIRDRAEA